MAVSTGGRITNEPLRRDQPERSNWPNCLLIHVDGFDRHAINGDIVRHWVTVSDMTFHGVPYGAVE
jgi:hypothetical protein